MGEWAGACKLPTFPFWEIATGGELPRASIWVFVYGCFSFRCGRLPRAVSHRGRVFGYSCTVIYISVAGDCHVARCAPRNDKAVRNLLSLPPRGKVDCRSIVKARRMRGKRRYVYYRDSIPLIRHSVRSRSAVSHRGHLLWGRRVRLFSFLP